MGKGKKKVRNHKVLMVEFRVSMHCNACERSVAKAISKVKGVETFMTDMPGHRVVVWGRIKGEKVVKKIRKKTGKRAEILSIEEIVDGDVYGKNYPEEGEWDSESQEVEETSMHCLQTEPPLVLDPCWNSEDYTMFSDENPNACSIM